jgi:unsaturated rhamnogalacturonyl hydrolase
VYLEIARRAFKKHVETHDMAHYTGILSLHAYARLAVITGDADMLAEIRDHLMPFVRGDVTFKWSNFSNYFCGGLGTAFLYWQGKLPEAEATLRHYAEDTVNNAVRDDDGILSMPNKPRNDMIWIDVAFAVTPFLLFCGLAFDEDRYIEEGFQQTKKMVDVLRDPENGLLHQARGFAGPGVITEDHWSRGNGWGIYALAELANYLPDDDPRRPAAEKMLVDLIVACLNYQDAQGMWHQEITDLDRSYVETSGTGLILYAIGVALEKGLIDDREPFERGLKGYLDYIRDDGSVYHTCRGNLAPGQGTILDYKAAPPVLNDTHAFGPVTLAYGQAIQISK